MADANNYWGTNKYSNEYDYDSPVYKIVPEDNRSADDMNFYGPAYDLTPNDNRTHDQIEYYGAERNYVPDDNRNPNELEYQRNVYAENPKLTTYGREIVYSTYAGTDIVAQMVFPDETITLGELQTISYSTHRENVPVRILGHVNPISFVRGPRTIAGSLIFTVFNYYAFYRLKSMKAAMDHCGVYLLADMLPPFDIVLTFANESGAFSKMKILGVQIIDEGGTMSVDDLVTEQTYSYMARAIQPMTGYNIMEEQ